MKKNLPLIVFILAAFWMTSAYSAEYATFEALYKESNIIGWIAAGAVALILGAIVFFSGGAASPFVVSIGTWVGGLMGLHGAAATSAGLALLGGGSIAAGGFGMIGGITILTAALSFSTDVVIDATVGTIVSEYNYKKLTEESKNMTTLPIPKNTSGPDSYEEAMEVLDEFNKDQSISSDHNQSVIRRAIGTMNSTDDGSLDDDQRAKKFSLYALLHFLINDYEEAKVYARQAIGFSKYEDIKRTLPAFIYATSSLYDEKLDYQEIKDNFRYAVLEEPENPLIPLLFSVYLDRLTMRIDDHTLDADTLKHVLWVAENNELSKYHSVIYTLLISRYFIRLKVEQQLISSFAMQANNPSIQKIADKVLPKLQQSHQEYNKLLDGTLATSGALLSAVNSSDDIENKAKANEFSNLYVEYKKDEPRLAQLIVDFEKKIAEIKEAEAKAKAEAEAKARAPQVASSGSSSTEITPQNDYYLLIFMLSIGLLIVGLPIWLVARLARRQKS